MSKRKTFICCIFVCLSAVWIAVSISGCDFLVIEPPSLELDEYEGETPGGHPSDWGVTPDAGLEPPYHPREVPEDETPGGHPSDWGPVTIPGMPESDDTTPGGHPSDWGPVTVAGVDEPTAPEPQDETPGGHPSDWGPVTVAGIDEPEDTFGNGMRTGSAGTPDARDIQATVAGKTGKKKCD